MGFEGKACSCRKRARRRLSVPTTKAGNDAGFAGRRSLSIAPMDGTPDWSAGHADFCVEIFSGRHTRRRSQVKVVAKIRSQYGYRGIPMGTPCPGPTRCIHQKRGFATKSHHDVPMDSHSGARFISKNTFRIFCLDSDGDFESAVTFCKAAGRRPMAVPARRLLTEDGPKGSEFRLGNRRNQQCLRVWSMRFKHIWERTWRLR